MSPLFKDHVVNRTDHLVEHHSSIQAVTICTVGGWNSAVAPGEVGSWNPSIYYGLKTTPQVVIAGYLNHHHVSSMYLGKGLIFICQPIKEGHFLIKVSLSKTTYVSKVCPNVFDVIKYHTLGNSSQVSKSIWLNQNTYQSWQKDESFGTFAEPSMRGSWQQISDDSWTK